MDKRVLFIGDDFSFIVNAVMDALKRDGFECESVALDVSTISRMEKKPPLFFLHVDEEMAENQSTLVFLRDLCVEEEKMIFLMGYPDELNKISSFIPDEIVGEIFTRPINAKEIADSMIRIVNKEEQRLRKKHILVVDDSGPMLHMIKGWLEPKYQVTMVNSAANALSFLGMMQPDLILLDYEMPVCSGPQMLQMIRSEVKTEAIPVIFLTAKGDRESVEKVLSLKPQGYLLKTMPPEKIVQSIDQYFATIKSKML